MVRVLRVLEYVGEREFIEDLVERSIHGVKVLERGEIRAATIGVYPDYLNLPDEDDLPGGAQEEEGAVPLSPSSSDPPFSAPTCPLCGVTLGGEVVGIVMEVDGRDRIVCEKCAEVE